MQNFIFENKNFKLVLSEDGLAKSLVMKHSGEELIPANSELPAFSATQDRPYNNEIKLAHPNKETTFDSSKIRLDEAGRLLVTFGLYPFEAVIEVGVKDEYISFTLVDFIADAKDYPPPMDFPPVTKLTLIQLPFDEKLAFGSWLNVVHTDKSCAAVMGTSPHAYIDAKCIFGRRILSATARRGIKLKGCAAALVCAPKEKFLDAVDSLEVDYDLPRGVASRRNAPLNTSVYWTSDLCPANADTHIARAKAGGFKLMLLYSTCMSKWDDYDGKKSMGYEGFGNYSFNENYPNGEADLRLVLGKIKAAGITPGLHFLHTHVGIFTKYVTPVADRRLHKTRLFTLTKPLGLTDDVIYVDENPIDCPIDTPKCRALQFDGEIISYESYTTEPPFMFTGCKRGHFNTNVTEHKEYTVGGVLDISEFTGTSIYLDQNGDLQDEIGDNIAKIYNAGFEFIYYDGSEGTNAPFDYHVPNAQYRMYKKMNKAPLFCEGAAKAHFGWHILSGGNAFDAFSTSEFKAMILKHPFEEAELMRNDFTRVNFGWWSLQKDTRVDAYEFGTSKAASYDCPATIIAGSKVYEQIARIDDVFEMMSRWEDVRAKGLLTEADKEMLRDTGTEYTLLKDKEGKYIILPYYEAPVADPDAPDATVGAPRVIGIESPAKSTVRAFVFEHNGDGCAVVWDDKGESTLTLSDVDVKAYTRELETEALAFTKDGAKTSFPVSSRAYIRTALGAKELARALKTASVK